jgi:hypothetical protein
MPIIVTGRSQQISYENGKFYVCVRSNPRDRFDSSSKHELSDPPLRGAQHKLFTGFQAFEDDTAKQLSIVNETGIPQAYLRIADEDGVTYRKCRDLNAQNLEWDEVTTDNEPRLASYFVVGQNAEIIPVPTAAPQGPPAPVHATTTTTTTTTNTATVTPIAPPNWDANGDIDTRNADEAISQTSLSTGQKYQIEIQFLLGAGLTGSSLETLKEKCQSRAEYDACLKCLIEGSAVPNNINQTASNELAEVKDLLIAQENFRRLTLNAANYYDGHIATAGEARQYVHDFLVAELQESQPNYRAPLLNTQAPAWSALCSPGQDIQASLQEHTETKKILDSMMEVYIPPGANGVGFGVKPNATQGQLIKALRAIDKTRNHINAEAPSSLGQCINLLVDQIALQAQVPKSQFLTNLEAEVRQKLQTPSLVDQPQPNQFLPVRVDQFPGGPLKATHADFLGLQAQHPEAIFLLPDNFSDAELADHERHKRTGRGGLAGPMAPQQMRGSTDQNPLYDLCTFGIPTGGTTTLGENEQKAKVQEYFARLYGELRRGRTIAVPRHHHAGGTEEWAFGGGVFAHSNITRFVQQEIDKLQLFCNGTTPVSGLEPAYQAAWENPTLPALPFADPTTDPAPTPAPQNEVLGVEADRSLTSGHMRTRFQEWFQANGHGELTYDDKKQTLTGTFSGGVDIVVYQNKVLFHKSAGPISDAELEASTRRTIDMYRSIYPDGNVPPLKAYGSEKQKEIIARVIRDEGIELFKAPTVNTPPTNNAPPQPPDGVQLRT